LPRRQCLTAAMETAQIAAFSRSKIPRSDKSFASSTVPRGYMSKSSSIAPTVLPPQTEGAPGGTRTHTEWFLRPSPAAGLGYRGLAAAAWGQVRPQVNLPGHDTLSG